VIQYLIHS